MFVSFVYPEGTSRASPLHAVPGPLLPVRSPLVPVRSHLVPVRSHLVSVGSPFGKNMLSGKVVVLI